MREVNARGGVLGRQVKIYRADDRGDKANAAATARRVVARGIHFVVGPYIVGRARGAADLPHKRSPAGLEYLT